MIESTTKSELILYIKKSKSNIAKKILKKIIKYKGLIYDPELEKHETELEK